MAKDRINWISHRGIRERYLENTYEAFAEAADRGFTELETDLRCTSDGAIVLCHDPNLCRIAGQNLIIGRETQEKLVGLKLSGGQKLLFFDEFTAKFLRCNWLFDIKPETGFEVIAALNKWRGRDLLTSQGRFLFWRRDQQAMFCKLFPEAVCLAREDECWRAGLSALCRFPTAGSIVAEKIYALPPRLFGCIDLYSKAMVSRFTSRVAHVMAFLPSTIDDMHRAIDAGIKEILTDGLKIPSQ